MTFCSARVKGFQLSLLSAPTHVVNEARYSAGLCDDNANMMQVPVDKPCEDISREQRLRKCVACGRTRCCPLTCTFATPEGLQIQDAAVIDICVGAWLL